MSSNNCLVPGCTYNRKSKGPTRSIFTVRRPEFAKSVEDRHHREELRRFTLSLRDASKGNDKILKLLHKESAGICEIHFDVNDIIQSPRRKVLRTGALPARNLPTKCIKQTQKKYGFSAPGIDALALKELQKLTSPIDAFMTVDDMEVRENLVYRDGCVTGLVDFGGQATEKKIATHICMLYVKSFTGSLSVLLSWWPMTVSPAGQKRNMFWEAVGLCEDNNVHIHAVVADQASMNKSIFAMIYGDASSSRSSSFIACDPFESGKSIFVLCDTNRLIKTIRDSLYSSKLGGAKHLRKNGQDILWTHIKEVYENDKRQS